MVRTPSKAWSVALPALPMDPVNFIFSTTLPFGELGFKFMWLNDVWNIWVTLPSGEIRAMGGYPNAVGWTGFMDYYVQLVTTLDSIGQNDLANVTLKVYQR